MQPTKILVGVCTYKRPQMLRNCLKHIASMEVNPHHKIVCFVVNNDSGALPKDLINSFLESESEVTFHFDDCSDRGIPQARNVILDYADEFQFDFCAFLDDDEYPQENWISELVKYQESNGCDAVQGEVINIYESKPWLFAPLLNDVKFGNKEDYVPRVVSTCNVLMARDLYRSEGKALRFDLNLALTGGSDKELFLRALDTFGTRVSFTPKARVYESIPASRTTIKWFFRRYARVESNTFIQKSKKGNHLTALISMTPRAILNVFNILFYTISMALTFYVANMRRKNFNKLLRYSARLWGFLSSALGNHINPYTTTTGS